MRIILRKMDLPGKSAALYRPRNTPIELTQSCHVHVVFLNMCRLGSYGFDKLGFV